MSKPEAHETAPDDIPPMPESGTKTIDRFDKATQQEPDPPPVTMCIACQGTGHLIESYGCQRECDACNGSGQITLPEAPPQPEIDQPDGEAFTDGDDGDDDGEPEDSDDAEPEVARSIKPKKKKRRSR
jgi:hypothetical protein